MISFKLVDPNAAASAVFLEQEYLRASLGGLLVPHKLLLVGQWRTGQTPAPTPNVPQLLLSADHAATLYGLGSPLHIMAIAAFAGCRNVPVYALPITAGGGAVAATGTINPTLTTVTAGTLSLYIAGKRVQVGVAATDTEEDICDAIAAAVNAMTELPVIATSESTDVKLDAKWAGLSGNDIDIAFDLVDGEADQEPGGITWVITPMATGATDPTIDTALAALDDTWYTEIVSQWTVDAQLDDIEDAGDARVLPGIQRPFAGFAGYNGTLADFLTLLASRNSAWTTLVPVDGSPNLKFEIAAAAAGVYAAGQQSRPGCPVRGSKLSDIMGGGVRWTYAQRDIVVKTGGSTFRVSPDGLVLIEDLCTTRTTNPLGALDESFRWTETIANLQAKLYSLEQVFASDPFVNAVVVDDDSVTTASYALRPKTAKAYTIRLIDDLWVPYALTKNRDAVVAGIIAEINGGNAGRIDVFVPDVFAAGLKIIAGRLQWSFTAPVA